MRNKPARSLNGKKGERYQIIVFNSDEMSFAYVIDAFQSVLGYELTQAANCANLIHNRGEYIVKSYAELSHAEAAFDMLCEFGFRCDVIDSFEK
jgi:ATP-dependent Clp protease adapter protein ClpS